jgi:hypothetical protein
MINYCINPNKSKCNCTALLNKESRCYLDCKKYNNDTINKICKMPHCSASLLIKDDLFNNENIKNITSSIFKDTYSTYMLVIKKPNLPTTINDQALKVISNSIFYSKSLIKSNKIEVKQKLQLVKNSNYQPMLVNSYLRETPKKNDYRKEIINKVFNDPDGLFSLACNGYLSATEKGLLYKNCGEYYFNKFHRNFKKYYLYCKTFRKQIKWYEREILFDKLLNKHNYIYVEEALKLFEFESLELHKLESIQVAMILSK